MRTIKVFALIFVFLVCGISSTYAADPQSSEEFVVEFNQPLSKKQLVNMVKKFNFVPTELRHQHEDMVSVYTIPKGMEVKEAFESMLAKHQEFLDVAISSTEDEIAKDRDTENKSRLGKMQSKFQSALKEVRDGMFRIHAVTVRDVGLLASREGRMIVGKVISAPRFAQKKEQMAESIKFRPEFFRKVSYSHELWAPYQGVSKVNQSMSFNTFYFNNVTSFKGWHSYEHETQVYDNSYWSDFVNYDNYHTSNMPSHYLDSRFADNPSIDNFAIGSNSPFTFLTNTQYYTYISFTAGNKSSATVRIKGQLGQKRYDGCYVGAWCTLYSLETTGSLATISAPISYQLPWTY